MKISNILLAGALVLLIGWGCNSKNEFDTVGLNDSTHSADAYYPGESLQSIQKKTASESRSAQDLKAAEELTPGANAEPVSAPSEAKAANGARIRINRIGNLRDLFNDSNKYQYAAAEKIGIKPISGVADAYYTRRPLIRINTCADYELDSLTHSMPFLVPEAANLLTTIGRNFRDSLKKRGGSAHKIRVTSVLRSAYSVKKLRRVNRNATDSSTHQFGTTFDISYARFSCSDESKRISDEDLKNLLGEVLFDLRNQGKCLVKFERKSPCFHITATGK